MSDATKNETLLIQLVAMFQFAAMQQMGKIPNPVTGKIERELNQARLSIDMVEMLHARTAAGRTPAEAEFLDKVLFELHMNYIDESKRPLEQSGAAPEDAAGGDPQ